MYEETTTQRGLRACPQLVADFQIHAGQDSIELLWIADMYQKIVTF